MKRAKDDAKNLAQAGQVAFLSEKVAVGFRLPLLSFKRLRVLAHKILCMPDQFAQVSVTAVKE